VSVNMRLARARNVNLNLHSDSASVSAKITSCALMFTRMGMVPTNVTSNSSVQAAEQHHYDLQIMLIC
jgi:hypothetical protein